MNYLLSWIMLFTLLFHQSSTRYIGFEQELDGIMNTYKTLIEDVEAVFVKIVYYFDNLETFYGKKNINNSMFVDSLNHFLIHSVQLKDPIYHSLKSIVLQSNEVAKKQKNFDFYLQKKHQNLLNFVANLPEKEVSPLLNGIFDEFKNQRRVMSYSTIDLKDNLQNDLINMVNLYDYLEEFTHEMIQIQNSKVLKTVSSDDISSYRFILGFLTNLRKLFQNHNSLLEKINKSLLSIENSIKLFDDSIDALDYYYNARFVIGVPEEDLIDKNASFGMADEVRAPAEDQKEKIQICDKMLMNNFEMTDVLEKVKEIDQYDKLQLCPFIEHSCCDADDLSRAYDQFFQTKLSVVKKRYAISMKILMNILNNFQEYNDFAYSILNKNINLSPNCQQKLKKLVFTPVNKYKIKLFNDELKKAHKFSINTKSNLYCFLCDYRFQKNILETGKIHLDNKFCSQIIENMSKFALEYNSGIMKYINAVLEALQCDSPSGDYENEFLLRLKPNQNIVKKIEDCEKNPDDCEEFCEMFSFHSMKSVLDLEVEKLLEIHDYIKRKMDELGLRFSGSIDKKKLNFDFSRFSVQVNAHLGNRSMNNMKYHFMTNPPHKIADPFEQGMAIMKVFEEFEFEVLGE